MIDTTRATRRTEDFIIKNSSPSQHTDMINPYGLKYRKKKQVEIHHRPTASLDTGSYWMNKKLATTQSINSKALTARMPKSGPREPDSNVTDIYNVDTWIDIKKMGNQTCN